MQAPQNQTSGTLNNNQQQPNMQNMNSPHVSDKFDFELNHCLTLI